MKIHLHIENLSITVTGELPSLPDLAGVPKDVAELHRLWTAGATSREIMEALGMTGAPDAGTTRVSQLRKVYPDLFPYRNPKSKRNGANNWKARV
jgi:hypothetical protein